METEAVDLVNETHMGSVSGLCPRFYLEMLVETKLQGSVKTYFSTPYKNAMVKKYSNKLFLHSTRNQNILNTL